MYKMPDYSSSLAKMYGRVAAALYEESARLLGAQAAAYERIAGQPLPAAQRLWQQPVPAPAALAGLAGVLLDAGHQAQAALAAEESRVRQAVERYDAASAAFGAAVDQLVWDDTRARAELDRFGAAVGERVQHLASLLAEERYDAEGYRQRLLDEVLNTGELGTLLAELVKRAAAMLGKEWETIAAGQGITLAGQPPLPVLAPAELAGTFLSDIQLQWERPKGLKSLMRPFSRDHFGEKLSDEVAGGMERLTAAALSWLAQAWSELNRDWLRVAQAGAAEGLRAAAGGSSAECVDKLARLAECRQQLAAWLDALPGCRPEALFQRWREEVLHVLPHLPGRHLSGL